jgi:hypothetical protein
VSPAPINTESIIAQLLAAYGITDAPVPIEVILQQPRPGMWEHVDLAELSGTFFAMDNPYSPRLALARLLIRLIAGSAWGIERGLNVLDGRNEAVYAAARILLMPRDILARMPAVALNPETVSTLFEVPLAEAKKRLLELEAMSLAD